MMGLLNAQGRFALTAFSPLLFNIALIAVMAVLLRLRQVTLAAAWTMAATVGIAGLLQLLMLLSLRTLRGNLATPLRMSFDEEMRGFFAQGDARHDRQLGPAMADGRRRNHRIAVAVGGVLAAISPTA